MYEFKQTCAGCPEQYDVYDGDRQVGYVRLRWGALRADAGFCGGDTVYSHDFGDDLKGMFADDAERRHYLNEIANALRRHYEKTE